MARPTIRIQTIRASQIRSTQIRAARHQVERAFGKVSLNGVPLKVIV
jgi:ribosomal protein L16/L10AE